MAIKNWLITGDTHGQVAERMNKIKENMPEYKPEETAVIILGDVGLLYYLNKTDQKHKREASAYGYTIYCIHGNHEARPGEKLGMKLVNDENVGGPVWVEEEFPLIRYFCDWGIYKINGLRTLVIGGSYSVDKFYRIQNNWTWFTDEQLADWEMAACMRGATAHPHFDLVLTHTCPLSVQPVDLFLGCIDQSTVDNSMEVWMDELGRSINWKIWLFGHYHADRIEWPHVEQFYIEIENLNDICARWKKFDETGELDWWLPVSPSMKKIIL